ncbi:response regulator [Anaerovibrio sp. JC8]|uniref:HD-GYP domain-containing protein n=1 Tax=Anaerovibrio sp. JC8 TaxID=1240085 RepID=UPI000A0D0775|nr:HD domain-containing phosphohydrolase [Anaerovibrio sp. JC8]ORT99247.1 response regulator [Anaerovibrio sp. JC8]
MGESTDKSMDKSTDKKSLILTVDDDPINNMILDAILGHDYEVISAVNGEKAIELIKERRPDLVLLDINMPVMNGFQVLEHIKQDKEWKDIPVIMLTAEVDQEKEVKGIQLGAFDFLHKPFIPTLILIHVQRTLELMALQKRMQERIDNQIKATISQLASTKRLFKQMVFALAKTIDAKDPYTNGHSQRVADYSREISYRAGKSKNYQRNIFYMALLHDIGKIGVSGQVLNKPDKLTPSEYSSIKVHPIIGSAILSSVHEMEELQEGARSHHERYDGTGYPDGLVGKAIPEKARIIAVADVYDAMTSKRSYRDVLPQSVVREELVKAKGTQLDPVFTDIMLQMIDEDVEYRMREQEVVP